jgi:hypothetical protein
MSFVASPKYDWKIWEFIEGDMFQDMSILVDRYYYLYELAQQQDIKIALRDPSTDKWTKHVEFPGQLFMPEKKDWDYNIIQNQQIAPALDVHRSILNNEIVVESDYPTYEENYEAAKIVGKMIEEKGFIPHYFYSGSKSIHIHIFLDWDVFDDLDLLLMQQLTQRFTSAAIFKRNFIKWLRTLMISCWGTEIKQFDTDLIRSSHLIRTGMSRNKVGFKTFLGYSHKDLSFIPQVCNENNRIYPKLPQIKLSRPSKINEIIEEYIEDLDKTKKEILIRRKNKKLSHWFEEKQDKELRKCVSFMLEDGFIALNDGTKRAMFILINELKKCYGKEKAQEIITDWNDKLEKPFTKAEIYTRLNNKEYNLSCKYIHSFLKEIGIDISSRCPYG